MKTIAALLSLVALNLAYLSPARAETKSIFNHPIVEVAIRDTAFGHRVARMVMGEKETTLRSWTDYSIFMHFMSEGELADFNTELTRQLGEVEEGYLKATGMVRGPQSPEKVDVDLVARLVADTIQIKNLEKTLKGTDYKLSPERDTYLAQYVRFIGKDGKLPESEVSPRIIDGIRRSLKKPNISTNYRLLELTDIARQDLERLPDDMLWVLVNESPHFQRGRSGREMSKQEANNLWDRAIRLALKKKIITEKQVPKRSKRISVVVR